MTLAEPGRALADAVWRRARTDGYPPGQYAGQESFMRADEVLTLAVRAGVAPGVEVLDLCCGVAGPGLLLARELGCRYTGIDASAEAVAVARERAAGTGCRFLVGAVPPVPAGPVDVVLLLETMLAFPDKERLVREVAAALAPGGRFAFTVEEGPPLTDPERSRMPAGDTVWPVPLAELVDLLAAAGMRVAWQAEVTADHLAVARGLARSYAEHADAAARTLGRRAVDDLVVSHELWCEWLASGRVRKYAVVATV